MSQIKPFPFDLLPQYSQKDARLVQDAVACLPRLGFSQKLATHISQLLTKELGESVLIKREKIDVCIQSDLVKRLPPQGIFAALGLNPSTDKLVAEIDPLLAFWSVDKLMGGSGELPNALRGLTEIEDGVLSFLILKVLAMIFEKSGTSARFHFRLEALYGSSDELAERLQTQKSDFVSLYFRVTFGKKSGFVRIYVPGSILESVEETAADREYLSARVRNYEDVSTSLWAEIGRVSLKAGDVNALESGDVILLESSARLRGRQVVGKIPLRVGLGQHGEIVGTLVNDADKVRIRVEAIQALF